METTTASMTTMQDQDYNCTFTVPQSPEEVATRIGEVTAWWGSHIDGETKNVNDEFTIHFGTTYVTFRITEVQPARKIKWTVTDSYIPWLNDKHEWTNTEVVFDISKTNDGTRVSMTHKGLQPSVECYENCRQGWNFYAGDSLKQLITTGKGKPDTPTTAR